MPPQASGDEGDGNEVDMTKYSPLSPEDILSQKNNGNEKQKLRPASPSSIQLMWRRTNYSYAQRHDALLARLRDILQPYVKGTDLYDLKARDYVAMLDRLLRQMKDDNNAVSPLLFLL
ncbi:hypothetical protein CDAR_463991 [Caerostris darwini]|uniref:Uncharacterized protein n=1 Tax=Caerostris darwini TaxID=1538125 RepID=A0AAV4VUL8_9ARAC|nr:hypothetical protein CDAR_463991 [Caerostris darwini]